MTVSEAVTVYEAGRHGVPDLRRYLQEVWSRRRFAFYMAKADLKARHYDTWFGQIWTVLNPLFLAMIYYLIVAVIFEARGRGIETVTSILAGLYAFYYTRNSLGSGASSIVGGGGLVMNTSMPRAILPLSSVISALLLYLPTLLVYAVFHILADFPIGGQLLWVPFVIALQTAFNVGITLTMATATVYFRDIASFLPYAIRIWLYVSPVLYEVSQVPRADESAWIGTVLLVFNPMFSIIGAWKDVLIFGSDPRVEFVLLGAGWSVLVLVLGIFVFLRKEGEFAVRI